MTPPALPDLPAVLEDADEFPELFFFSKTIQMKMTLLHNGSKTYGGCHVKCIRSGDVDVHPYGPLAHP